MESNDSLIIFEVSKSMQIFCRFIRSHFTVDDTSVS